MKNLAILLFLSFLINCCSKSDANQTETKKEIESLISLPSITTTIVSKVTSSSVISGGNVTKDGGVIVTSRGVCWSTESSPTITDSKTSNASGIGEYNSTIEGLESNTTYYLRSYATNSEGTTYGNEVSFTTLELIVVTKIFDGDVLLTSQQEVDDFGAEYYTEITGSLEIRDLISQNKISNIDALETLSIIGENLKISSTEELENLDGLENLVHFEGELIILNNSKLGSIETLSIITNAVVVSIDNNDSLISLNGLENLVSVGGLFITDNALIEKVDIFKNLEFIGKSLFIANNLNLNEISNFDKWSSNGVDIYIYRNSNLLNISSFGLLINANLIDISENQQLKTISGFQQLETVDEKLVIVWNKNLEDILGFEELKKAEILGIHLNYKLSTMPNFSKLAEVGALGISFLQIENLDSLSSIVNCPWDISIEQNELLSDFCGLQFLTGSTCEIRASIFNNAYNPSIQDLRDGNCSN